MLSDQNRFVFVSVCVGGCIIFKCADLDTLKKSHTPHRKNKQTIDG